ncbi:MAG: SDR family NAD(P)-dependent oxidoreductase [Candidatus Heimdallarchaeota archaeon]|nr:SDR family NAD(P)-dependent oxidoreductase [Candidatus Heimdallarchaeota archaeon]
MNNKSQKKIDGKAVVLGATGGLGSAVVFELVKRERSVIAVTRNLQKARKMFQNIDVEIRQADLMDQEQTLTAVQGADVVYHCVNVLYTKWLKEFPIINNNILAAVKEVGANLVFADNLYMYGEMQGDKISEEHPLNAESKKGKLRVRLAKQILDAHSKGDINAVIVRFGDFYGPNVVNGFTKPLLENPVKGKAATWLVDLDKKHSLMYIVDAAKGMVMASENPNSYGQIFHVEGAESVTGREFITMIFQELNQEPNMKVLSESTIKILAPFIPIVKELKELTYEWKHPFIIDGTKYVSAFNTTEHTVHKIAIKETLDWFKQT